MSSNQSSSSQHFVLVHGVGHGAWCWFEIQTLLESSGHKVTCLDLAGAGIHPSNADGIRTFEDYDRPLFDFMSSLPTGEKVSTLLMYRNAHRYIYVCLIEDYSWLKTSLSNVNLSATMLPFGFLSQEEMKDAVPDLSAFGDVYKFRFFLGEESPPTSVALKTEFQRPILYQLAPEQYSTLASMLLRPWPALVFSRAIFKGEIEKINKTKRVFIKTAKDNMVKPEQQDAMIRKWPPNVVFTMETDHSPFFSDTQQLFKLLLQAVYE